MYARLSVTVIAPLGQVFSHFLQPMQLTLHAFMATGPFAFELQVTTTFEAAGIISMI